MILIGSRALKLRVPKVCTREPKDFDFLCSMDDFKAWLKSNEHKIKPTNVYPEKDGRKMIVEGEANCEFEIIQPNSSSELLEYVVKTDKDTINSPFGLIPSLDLLFTLKSSHKYLKNSPHFWKTLVDYHLLKKIGCKIRPEYLDFLKMREKETYSYKHPKLNQSKESFFSDDNVKYSFDHDSIHKSVALLGTPAYTFYMKDGAEVQCDKDRFFRCDDKVQLAGVIEEACVLAIERSLVPFPGKWDPKYAWKFALSKVCTSITSGWFREFAYENALKVIKMYPENYWDKFQNDVKNGLVKSF